MAVEVAQDKIESANQSDGGAARRHAFDDYRIGSAMPPTTKADAPKVDRDNVKSADRSVSPAVSEMLQGFHLQQFDAAHRADQPTTGAVPGAAPSPEVAKPDSFERSDVPPGKDGEGASRGEQPEPDLNSERTLLQKRSEDFDSDDKTKFRADMAAFEKRMKGRPDEVAATYHEISQMLELQNKAVIPADRVQQLAREVMAQSARPSTVDQG